MPSNRLGVRYTPQAEADITEILHYSLQRFGEHQQKNYQRTLQRAVAVLAGQPRIGRSRNELQPGLQSHPVGSHMIYYQADSNELQVVRILHARRDPSLEDW